MPADTASERLMTFHVLKASITAIASVIGRNTEIVLHDLDQPENSVLLIANGHVSGRKVGSPVLGGLDQDRGFSAVMDASAKQSGTDPVVISDYPTTVNGRTLRSATAVFRDSSGHPFASLCINADLTGLNAAQAFLEQLQPMMQNTSQQLSEPADMELLMGEIIQDSLARVGSGKMNKQAKVDAVRVMQDRGLFIVKGGVEKAATALGVTRFTVYNYLEQLRVDASVTR
ncbi:helix-turn-helix transcriptional regulator [Pseudomonas veronii]|uniref:helix-turn-helix transcriptional regulator n=1 Tax=Pseudomonas veronii TaxID=76761 RepID=UPI0021BE061B|nr:PAS domain-containing protein [Pseudomonas veronii]MCT9827748.1 PAS domain-containing protein [Pseudomonas veronii]